MVSLQLADSVRGVHGRSDLVWMAVLCRPSASGVPAMAQGIAVESPGDFAEIKGEVRRLKREIEQVLKKRLTADILSLSQRHRLPSVSTPCTPVQACCTSVFHATIVIVVSRWLYLDQARKRLR
jgi:hypothetical protein